MCLQAWFVLQCPVVLAFVVLPFWAGLGWKRIGWKRRRFLGIGMEETSRLLASSESNVRQWRRVPAGLVRPSGPCCFGICSAAVLGWTWLKIAGRDLVFFQVLKATLGSGDVCLQAWSVLQGPAVLAFVVLLFWAGLG